jgi:ribonucleoside-diphosphate reductase alpha chain
METHELARKRGWKVGIDYPEWGNNSLYLTTITGGYLQEKESPRAAYNRLASTAAKLLNMPELEEKFFEILWKGWLIPSTPVMSNMGTDRGLPISCFASYVGDDMYDIGRKNLEVMMLSKHGGGTACDFSGVRPIGSLIKGGANGTSDGIIPFIKVTDSTILASKQGKMRRGANAIYLNAEHKEYPDFLDIREPKGDINRQCHNIHQGAIFTDDFMNEVVNKDGKKRSIWVETLKKRVKTGEPYTLFIDNANKAVPKWWKKYGLKIRHPRY